MIDMKSLVSGILGAIIGVLGSYGLYFLSRFITARAALRAKLLESREVTVIHDSTSIPPAKWYSNNFQEVWRLLLEYRETIPFLFRREIDAAWSKYKGAKTTFLSEHYAPPSNDDVERRVDALLKAVGYKRPE